MHYLRNEVFYCCNFKLNIGISAVILKSICNFTVYCKVKVKWKWKWSRSVVFDSLRPVDCSPPSPSVHGILQARILEWATISFSYAIATVITKAIYIHGRKQKQQMKIKITHNLPVWTCVFEWLWPHHTHWFGMCFSTSSDHLPLSCMYFNKMSFVSYKSLCLNRMI